MVNRKSIYIPKEVYNSNLYHPREDTYLIEDYILENKDLFIDKEILEMFCGYGYISILLKKIGAKRVVSVDINEEVLKIGKKLADINNVDITFIKSDVFDNVVGTYDIIIANPPYLKGYPRNIEELSYYAGPNLEIVYKFLSQLPDFMKDDGFALLVLSSLSDLENITKFLNRMKLDYQIVKKKHIFFEDLYLLKIEKKKEDSSSR